MAEWECSKEPSRSRPGLCYCATCDPGDRLPYPCGAYRQCGLVGNLLAASDAMQLLPSGPDEGPGTELKRLLALFWIKEKPGCLCASRVRVMNTKGIAWCRENVPLIEKWMRQEARRRKLPFVGIVSRRLIYWAIRRAEKKRKSGE